MTRRGLHFAGNLSGLATGLVTAPLTARALGPDGRGEVAIVVVVSTVVMTVAALGLPWLARSEFVQDPMSLSFWRRRARNAGLLLFPLGAGAGIGLALTLGLAPAELAATTVLFVLSVFTAARGVEANALISMGRPGIFGAANLAASALTFAVIVIAFVSGVLSVLIVLWTTAASVALQVVLTVVFVRRMTREWEVELAARARELHSRADHRGGALVSRAGRAWSSQIAESLAVRGDTIAVALMSPAAQVGLYSVVALIPQAAYAVFTTVVQTAYSRQRAGDELTRFMHVFHSCGVVALMLAFVAAPVAWWGLPIVFGDDFTAAREYLPAALAITVGLGAFVPVLQRMSSGKVAVFPLAAILGVTTLAVAVVAVFGSYPAVVLALGLALLVGSLVYAIIVTRGAVLVIRPGDTRAWWQGATTNG